MILDSFRLENRVALVTGGNRGLGAACAGRGGTPRPCRRRVVLPRRNPGAAYMATDNTKALRDDPDRASAILDRIPAGRWGGRPGPRNLDYLTCDQED